MTVHRCPDCGRASVDAPDGLLVVCACGRPLATPSAAVTADPYRSAGARDAPPTHLCPRCAVPLIPATWGPAEECPRCFGALLGDAALGELLRARGGDFATLLAALRPDARPAIACPVRGCAPLHPVRVEDPSVTLLLDRCPTHGTWFDGAELAGAVHVSRSPERRVDAFVDLQRSADRPPPPRLATPSPFGEAPLESPGDVVFHLLAILAPRRR